MRYLASRLAIVSSLVFLILWILASLVGTCALAVGDYGRAAFLARPAWSIDHTRSCSPYVGQGLRAWQVAARP